MNFLSAEDRYRRDPLFSRLVDMMTMHIEDLQLTPTEMREAAMLACLRFEQMHPRPMVFEHPSLSRSAMAMMERDMIRPYQGTEVRKKEMSKTGNTRALAAFIALTKANMLRPEQASAASLIFAVCFPEEFKEMNDDWPAFFCKHKLSPTSGLPLSEFVRPPQFWKIKGVTKEELRLEYPDTKCQK